MRTSLRSVSEIEPALLAEPVQSPATNAAPVTFTRNDYRYEVTPVAQYQLTGLIVHTLNYSWFSIDRSEKAFPVDVCMIWGDNLRNNVHRNRSVQFSQDCRWCNVQWHGNVPFNLNQISNNHLLTADPKMESRLKSLLAGDQVRLTGKLVNVKAVLIGQAGQYDSTSATWNTSTTRTDSGAGACEVILVEKVEILLSGNPLSRTVFRMSLYGLGLVSLWSVIAFFRK